MATGRYADLRGKFSDHLHQPFRAKFVPFLDRTIAAATKAGALGGFLSGSGSAVAALTLRNPEKVAAAMLAASGLSGASTIITTADNRGTRLSANHSFNAPLA
jgi:homoserine kinase